jgi:tol-pal system protein YbgF
MPSGPDVVRRVSRSPRLLGGGLPLACALACAGVAPDARRAAELEKKIETLRAQNAAYARQVEELENRVFILTDQLDSRRVAAGRAAPPPAPAPELPKVMLTPGDPTPPAEPQAPPQSLLSDSDIEYAGEAARPSPRRPILRLEGSGPLGAAPAAADEAAGPATAAAAAVPAPAPVALAVPVVGADERGGRAPTALVLYKTSLEHLRGRRHGEAVSGFRDFIRRFPDHDYADNAQYWLGECYYDLRDFAAAAREFRRVVQRFPQGNKVPDALLKAAFSHLQQGSLEPGREALEELLRTFPRHEAAGLAQAKLAELGRGAAGGAPNPAPGAPGDGGGTEAGTP